MAFDGTDERASPLRSLFDFLSGVRGAGAPPARDPIAEAQADIARRARLPRVGGLFGGDYARFMADRAPASYPPAATGAPDLPHLSDDGRDVAAVGPPIAATEPDGLQGLQPADPQRQPPLSDVGPFLSVPQLNAHAPQPTQADGPPDAPGTDRASQLKALADYLSRKDVEGYKPYVYRDSRQILTAGVGHKVVPADHLKAGQEVSDPQIKAFLQKDAAAALDAARSQAAEAGVTDPNFIVPLGSVNFQLGTGWTKKFKNTWPLIVRGDYAAAADEAARSAWNAQTPQRVRQFQRALRSLPPKPGG